MNKKTTAKPVAKVVRESKDTPVKKNENKITKTIEQAPVKRAKREPVAKEIVEKNLEVIVNPSITVKKKKRLKRKK